MNFYKHHLGDYAAATVHLTWDEDAALRRLLDCYYKREAPIPADIQAACRLARATTESQREAVKTVLEEFFDLCPDGWRNSRCDAEIRAATDQAATNKRIADEREAKRRTRSIAAGEETRGRRQHESFHGSSHESFNESYTVTCVEREPTQTPDSRLQTSKETHTPGQAPVVCVDEVIKAMRDAGIPGASTYAAQIRALIVKRVPTEQFAAAARIAASAGKGAAYAFGVIKQQLRDEAATGELPAKKTATPVWDATRSSIEAKGVELGLGKWDQKAWRPGERGAGESFSEYTARVRAALERRDQAP